MHSRGLTGWLSFINAVCLVRSEVRFVSSADLPSGISDRSWKSATAKYYGPQSGSILNGTFPATYIEAICDPGKWPSLEGEIAVFPRFSRTCSMDEVYQQLSKAKAIAAAVAIPYDPPDIFSHVHFSWDRCRFCGGSMYYVFVSDPNDKFRYICSRHEVFELSLLYSSSTMSKMYESLSWLLVLRILVPVFAFCTAAMAAFEVYREVCSADFKRRGPYSVRIVICILESPSLFVVGCALALGEFGPMSLPWPIHVALTTLLYGVSLFTSTTLAIYLKEENRRSKAGRQEPRRSIWNTHRVFISVAFAVFVGSDLILIISIVTLGAVTSPTTQIVFEIVSIIVILAGLVVASSFIYQAWQLRFSIEHYLFKRVSPADSNGARSLRRVGRLAFWLFMSALAIVMHFVMSIAMMCVLLQPLPPPITVTPTMNLVVCALYSVSRISISHAQVQGLRLTYDNFPVPSCPPKCLGSSDVTPEVQHGSSGSWIRSSVLNESVQSGGSSGPLADVSLGFIAQNENSFEAGIFFEVRSAQGIQEATATNSRRPSNQELKATAVSDVSSDNRESDY